MKVTVIPAVEMDEALRSKWREIQSSDPALANPYFCPEFTLAASSAFPKIMLGVIEDSSGIVGFLPFERGWDRSGRAVVPGHSDYQAVIMRRDTEWEPRELVSACGLRSWEFETVIASQVPLAAYHTQTYPSHVIANLGPQRFTRILKLAKQLERKVGPVRFEFRCSDGTVFDRLITMKRQQYARTGGADALADPCMRGLLRRVYQTQENGFQGVLSALYCGDELIAANIGMRASSIWQWWFPAYLPEQKYKKYSPGLMMLAFSCCEAPRLGITAIDLGYGDEPYKMLYTDRTVLVASGLVGASWPASLRQYKQAAGQCKQAVKRYVTGTRLEGPVRVICRQVRRLGRNTPAGGEC